jgi:hypothetical protein
MGVNSIFSRGGFSTQDNAMARQMFQKSHVQRHGSSDESSYLRLFKPIWKN